MKIKYARPNTLTVTVTLKEVSMVRARSRRQPSSSQLATGNSTAQKTNLHKEKYAQGLLLVRWSMLEELVMAHFL